jgi:hypothetical protein
MPAIPSTVVAGERKLRILFVLLHSGFLRHYQEPIALLAERGHHVSLAIMRFEKDPGDRQLMEDLVAASPRVEAELAPLRSRLDMWRGLAWLSRALADVARYMHPRYADMPVLRDRTARKLLVHVHGHRGLDPISRALSTVIVGFMRTHSGARLSQSLIWLFGRIDRAVPASPVITRYIESHDPDVVLVTPLVDLGSHECDYLKSAQKLGIHTGACIASWDNLSLKGLLRYVPDRVLVWNDVQRREAVELHGIPEDRVVLTGAQKFDEWFERRPSTTPGEFRARVGLDPAQPHLLYLCSSSFIAPDEVGFVKRWLTAVRASEHESLRRMGVLVRPHPQNAGQWSDVDLGSFGNVAVHPRAGAIPDAGEARTEFFDSLSHCEAVVGINTSALIEAGVVGKSVFTVLSPEFRQEDTLHFHYLLEENGGMLRTAASLDDHVAQLARALDGDTDPEQTRRFIASFVRPCGLDRPAAPIVADAVEELARLPDPVPERTTFGSHLLRAVLSVVAATAWAAAAVRGVYRRVVLRRFPEAETA